LNSKQYVSLTDIYSVIICSLIQFVDERHVHIVHQMAALFQQLALLEICVWAACFKT